MAGSKLIERMKNIGARNRAAAASGPGKIVKAVGKGAAAATAKEVMRQRGARAGAELAAKQRAQGSITKTIGSGASPQKVAQELENLPSGSRARLRR